jgi:hypothetical protein
MIQHHRPFILQMAQKRPSTLTRDCGAMDGVLAMNTSRLWLLAPVALMMAVSSGPAMAADPTIREVYAAAHAGQVDKALDMMNVVLKDHPNSAKAHFIEAELLAHQHRYAEARAELGAAEKLAPGLPGIQPQAVSALKAQLNGGPTTAGTVARSEVVPQASHGFPWGLLIIGGVIVFVVLAILRRRNRVDPYQAPMGGAGYGGNPYGGPQQGGPGFGGGYGQPGYGAPQQGGFGSGLMGNLAAGAAAGVGIAAGERLIDGMFGGHDRERVVEREAPSQPQWNPDDANRDMGGNDFGISDDSSWDSSDGGGGGDDW